MAWAAVAGAAIGVGGSLLASSNAADAQTGAANSANALSQAQFDQMRADQAPYRQAGYSALDRLSQLLGLSQTPPSSAAPMGSPMGASGQTADQIRQQLLPQFSTPGRATVWDDSTGGGMNVDTAGLNAAVQQQLQNQQNGQRRASPTGPDQQGPAPGGDFGSLLQPFTGASVATDPGYQFGLTQGMKAVDNGAAARGGLFSGAQLRAEGKFGNDYATTKFGDAFNRDQITKNSIFNKLSGVAGTGQAATNQVDTAGTGLAQGQGQNLIGAGNARGASYIAGGNALQGGVNQVLSQWQLSQQPQYQQTPYVPVGLNYAQGDGW